VLIREREARPVALLASVEAERSDAGPAVLVRPDGYIAWVGDSFRPRRLDDGVAPMAGSRTWQLWSEASAVRCGDSTPQLECSSAYVLDWTLENLSADDVARLRANL